MEGNEVNEGSFIYKIYTGLNVLYTCAIFNFLFLLGTILGFGIFGFGPSLLTIFHLSKKYHKKELNHPFSEYWKNYKKTFIRGNQIVLPIFISFFFILWNISLFLDEMTTVSLVFLSIIQILLMLMLFFACSLAQFYELNPIECLLKSLQFSIYNIIGSLLTILWTAMCFYGSLFLPGLFLFFTFGLWSIVTMGIHLRLFELNEVKLIQGGEEKEYGCEVVKASPDYQN